MFWRYLSLTLLLLSPGSRILTSATYEDPEEGRRLTARETDDALIDRIVSRLVASEQHSQGGQAQGEIPQANEPGKRDNVAGTDSTTNTDANTNNQQQQQSDGGVKPDAQDPKGETSSTYVGVGGTGSSSSESAGVKGSEPVVHHPPGVAAPLSQQAAMEGNRGSKVIAENDKEFMITMAAIACVGFVGLMMAGVCYYKFRRSAKAASDVEYPAYGVTGPMKERVPSPGDRKLAQSAQMYHYQHQKQQMIAMEKANGDMKHDASDDDSEEDNVEGDYTVYECPGLAPTGEMEVKNPLFRGDDAPQPPGPPDLPGGQQHTPPRE